MPERVLPSGRAGRMARATRAYLAGIGTSGSLLAGAALMFVLASALVAFRGWPHVAAQPSPGEVVVSPRSAAATSPVARRLAFIVGAAGPGGAAAPRTATGAAPAGSGRIAAPGARRSIGGAVSTSQTGGATAAPVAGGSTGASGCGAGSCGSGSTPTPAPGPVPSVPPPQQVLQKVTGTLGSAVAGTGSTVSSAVQQTTAAVGGAVGTVSPSLGNAVSGTGTGAANTVGGVTKTVGGALSGLGH